MALNRSLNITKNVLNTYNLLLLFIGIGVITVVIWTLTDHYQYVDLLVTETYRILINFQLAIGILSVLTAFLGCYSVLSEVRPLILLYVFLLLLIFVINSMVGILAFVYEENVQDELQLSLNGTFLQWYHLNERKTTAIDYVQETFKCCGAISFSDWQHAEWFSGGNTRNKVPDSCCKTITEHCGRSWHPSNIYNAACSERIERHLDGHLTIMCWIGFGICLLQIFGIFYACKLYLKLRTDCQIEEKNAFL